eukprot:TRINITY_DN2504_c2_g1_i4.p1 TRINITY_DN2504_c2_g1~~TRINITY_DN2504_c2_g1_i4.p1  ORF type:complete len:580 (+),score=150.99 TRINITY_DN2504_c2_g1_i4:1-1740(+)
MFCDLLVGNLMTKYEFTIDYFDSRFGLLHDKENPTSLNFCVALLLEILCKLKPSHELWDKIKYAAFLLNLATRNIDFGVLYEIFHQMEVNVKAEHWSWCEAHVKSFLAERIAEKFIVKDDVCSLPDVTDIKRDEDYVEDDQYNPTNRDSKDLALYDNIESDKDDLSASDDDMADADFVVDTKEQRLAEAEEGFDEEEMSDKKVDLKKLVKEEKPKKLKKKRPYRKKTEEEKRQPKVLKKRGRPRKNYFLEQSSAENDEDKVKMLCHLCNFKAKSHIGLERHAFEQHEANQLCTQCGHLSETFDDYLKHDKSHSFNCEVCQKNILGARNLKVHMKMHETKKEDGEVNRIPCDICGHLLRANSMYSHMLHVHSSEVHKCDVCDFTTNTKPKLNIHRRKHFKKLVECPECKKMVKDLNLHFFRSCANKKKERLPCHLCNKSFAFKDGLERHIKHIHQKIMNFHCEHCDYKTYSGFNLRIHISKMHTKEEMEKICQFCNQKTVGLDYHIRIYHMDEHLKSQANKQESLEDQLRSPDLQINNQAAMKEQQQMQPGGMMGASAQFHTQIPGINKQEDPHSLDAPT